ncbi:hypothetical protein F5Y14DRAFT_413205 [Nemania sp. NC0429]|nr:hypothetical protein F5Y14DRAFT_413205 [Nemania sp. NC0429]
MHLAQPPESFGDDVDYHGSIFPMATDQSGYDPLDDIFGPGPDSPLLESAAPAIQDTADISLDTRRLRAQHNTVGYREGITAGKAGSIQAGFDQGFSLGARIGTRAGQILGLLEGIRAALVDVGPPDEFARADRLLSRATAELNPESLFTSQFWASDGAWIYPVKPSHEGGDILGSDVADQHPLIATWNRIAHDIAGSWRINHKVPILQGSESSSALNNSLTAPGTSSKNDVILRNAINW